MNKNYVKGFNLINQHKHTNNNICFKVHSSVKVLKKLIAVNYWKIRNFQTSSSIEYISTV